MKKTCFVLPLFLLPLALLFIGHAAAADTSAGTVQIENRSHADTVFSCDVKLSGGQIRGNVFAVLFAESGQMKSLSGYPAAETVQVTLQNVANTDCIKIVWADANQTPLASPAVLRMSGNGAAAYAQFSEELMKLQDEYGDIGGGAASGDDDPYILARLLVSCTELPDLSAYNVAATIKGPDNLYVLQFQSAEEARKCAEYLLTCPAVRYAEPDGLMYADSAALMDASAPPSWGAEATGITAYAENLRQRGMNGTIVVAVVDSGADMTHSLLKDRLVSGYDFVGKDSNPQDEHGHGTHVSGIIASCTPDMNVKIMPLRVLDAYGGGNASNIGLGIYHAAKNGANVINLSLGLARHSSYVEEAISYAISKNITVVVAAGNQNSDVKSHCPAHMAECVTVAAVDSNWKRFELSNYGDAVDIAAPGVAVNSSIPGGGYKEDSGTSMAAPHVSAAAALLMEERGTAQTPAQISGALRDSAASLDTSGANAAGEAVRLGAGFLNLTPFIIRTISFYANGGTGTMTPQSAASGSIVALKANTFARDGYRFAGWNTNADGSGTAYTDGATLTVSQNLSLYAQWEQDRVSLSWGTTATHMDEYAALLQKRGNLPEVIVAEIGSGVDASHPFLQGRLVPGYDFVEQDDDPQDEYGHGTHVAGIIADCTPDNVKIMPVRVLDAYGGARVLNIIAIGIHYAVNHGANVICLPLGLREHSQTVENAINYALSKGITVVVAAGNQNDNASTHCPAHIADCITVAAVDQNLKRFWVSNYGDAVDIAAPGVDITSCLPGNRYGKMSGTSMAAPYVSAAAALLMCEYGTDQKPAQIAERLKNAATPIPEDSQDSAWQVYQKDGHSWSEFLGAGFLNMSAFKEIVPVYAMLYADGEMVFQKSNVPASDRTLLQVYSLDSLAQYAGWYSRRNQIQTVTFADKFQPVSTALWFYSCENLKELRNPENLDTSRVTNMSQMFARCTKLETLDLSAWDTANVTDMEQMFYGCGGLKTIYASDKFTTASVPETEYYNSRNMFYDCTSLVGGAGTKYDSGHTDKAYARIDGGASAPGYFTRK